MLNACLGMVPPERIEKRLAEVRAQILHLRELDGTTGVAITIDLPELRQLVDEQEFLEVLAS